LSLADKSGSGVWGRSTPNNFISKYSLFSKNLNTFRTHLDTLPSNNLSKVLSNQQIKMLDFFILYPFSQKDHPSAHKLFSTLHLLVA
jgi:hypothetical protein